MDSGLSKAHSSLENEIEGTSSKIDEDSYKELSTLVRIRDFIMLLLTYPMKLDEEDILKSWIGAFSEWKTQLLSMDGDTAMEKPWHEPTKKVLRRMQGFMPRGIISQIERGERSICKHNNDLTPEAILHMTVDLAVNQLIQTLFSRDYSECYVRMLTTNLIEKRSVLNKIVAALEEKKHYTFGTDKDFLRPLWINASTYESDAEVRVQEEINTMMAAGFSATSTRHLVIVVDADSNKKLDLQKVHFPTGIVVLITNEPLTQADKDDDFRMTCTMDLNIRIHDHLLPWEVFCSYVGNINVHSSSMAFQRIAVQIVEECHGHLFAIVLVANYLKNVKDVKDWELALTKLSSLNYFYDYQGSDRIGIYRVMVNALLNIIWEDIDDTRKMCLEISLFVHNIKIGVTKAILVSNWENIYAEFITQARYDFLKLADCFVLLKNENDDVYLPIETYDIINSLHTSNPSIIRHVAAGLTEPPHIGRWHGLIRMELMDNKICELPQSPKCPKLKVLWLQGNVDLMDIPDSFFNHMPLLRHLDLSYTSIRNLPLSFFKLIQLRKFYLRGCDLFMELPPEIRHLKNLEELDLEGTLITHLPKEVGELMKLQSLTASFDEYHHGKKEEQISNSIIPPGVISNLALLNCLSINVDPGDERWNENVTSVLMEIFGSNTLETVNIYVPRAELLECIPSTRFLNFKLVVGHHVKRFISRVTPELEQKFKNCDYSIKFVNGVNVPNGVKMNLGHFKALYLDRHMTIKSLSDFELRNLSGLQVCILAECNEMETIVHGNNLHDELALPKLQFLSVFYMKNLRSIREGSSLSFFHLKSIALHTCPMLTTIFTSDSLNTLFFLEEIIVEDCPKVTTLISHDSSEQKSMFHLPKLRRVLLLYLPELVNIFNGLCAEHKLQEMVFYYCPKLQSFSKWELSSKSLKIIKGESIWWETLKWNAAEWEDVGGPKFFDHFFSPINEVSDMMIQLGAHQETQLSTFLDENKLQRKRKKFVPLEGPHPPSLRIGKESDTFGLRKSRKAAKTQTFSINTTVGEFGNLVRHYTGQRQSLSEKTSFSDKESIEGEVDDITHIVQDMTSR
ncbi:disease resistance protein RPS2 isoform X2 [Cajanus cajan]|uniref:disease resistance protein RPS2 isoform X2 n=1 Tax=Cajanus cajan TaxID=3821 RepID=UPI0010FB951C|nr:disease resistance protein RPS2 isoform X2 [Cajanus cajan]